MKIYAFAMNFAIFLLDMIQGLEEKLANKSGFILPFAIAVNVMLLKNH